VIRVGVDYWPATTHAPGVGRYVRELSRALAARDDLQLRLLEVGPGARVLGEPHLGLSGRPVKRVRLQATRRVLDVAARLGFGADRWLGGCDVFHGVFAARPRLSRALRTCAVSELPHERETADFGAALRDCSGVLTFSRFAAATLCGRFDLPQEQVHVIPVGCEHWRRQLPGAVPLDDPPTVLVLVRLDERRNPLVVLRACEQLSRSGVDLRLAYLGRPGDAYDALRAYATRSSMSSRIRWDSAPREDDLPRTVAGAAVLVHLSDDEFTPVTPLEALATGCGVVATRAPAFVEALGPHARWIDAPAKEVDAGALAEQIAGALQERNDAALRNAREAHAAAYSWRRHASLTLDVWRRILSDGRR